MNILGVSCFYHDSAAALLKDGELVSAASEERFNRQKSSPLFPIHAVNYCLQQGDRTISDVDYIVFYEKPFLKFHRVIAGHLQAFPFSLKNFLDTIPHWLKERLIMPLVFENEIGFKKKVLFAPHHMSHAASAFFASDFEEAAFITADGVGEWATTTYGVAKGNDISVKKEMRYPDSLGLLYTAVTTFLGFKALEGEGKVMGLAGYGSPRYRDEFDKMVAVASDGSYHIDQRYFGFNQGRRMYRRRFLKLFGKERIPGEEINQRHCDIAASLQQFTEDAVLSLARQAAFETKMDNLCLAGGLFLNCVANARIAEEALFKNIFIQPAAGDSGGAVGAALWAYHSLLGTPRGKRIYDAYLGPSFTPVQIKRAFAHRGIAFREIPEDELCRYVAEKIYQNKIVGWFQGRMEFGPRALGNRSIVANPCNPAMKKLLNQRVKLREAFRPYAPAVLAERAEEFFSAKQFSPFMLLAAQVKEKKRSLIPAVTHVDGSARVQIVDKNTNPRFWRLIHEFSFLSGVPILINTSFNLRGEPIVCSPADAIKSFMTSQMDCLVLDNFVCEKNQF
ncbi:MAG: carbamoyltransferase [Candidatus Omnitrophica bacterium]|nr:carbamoyltransferase [Candidatus Omnitrophota bacterium]